MSSADTNAVRFSVSNDVCEHANGLDQWLDNRYHQLEKKSKFHGMLSDIQLDKRVRVTKEIINTRRRQKLSATPDLSGTVLPLCHIPNSALKNAPPSKSATPRASACAGLLA
ncbi:hypothetical protein ATY02_19170 [Pseudomonas sp. BIOMIG1BAC]|uniref:hypothetical protein n=1 Tax=Pseudomonas sp. BIOMIG1BAC TaxID=1758730 RepID=UPI0013E107B1|nr:hypothetical protein [Pseudomonas sp. BIOMIG1BAC]QIH08691.1 hypothetical protein ATY02_19170 [Pseudomonas sp. BIOMIG1BAC]